MSQTQTNTVSMAEFSRPMGPGRMALSHLLGRRIAMMCFALLVLYALIGAATYIPGLGTWLEEQSTVQHIDPKGTPLVFEKPRVSTLDLSARTNERSGDLLYTADQVAAWTAPPRLAVLLGTDIQGRSVFWRTLFAARLSMTIALGATILSVVIGTTLGAIAGYLGGLADVIITWLFTTVASIPRILLILALAYSLKGREDLAVWGIPIDLSGARMLIVAMGLTTWVGLCRVIRGEIMKQKSMDYESAARALGFGRARILVNHLLPNAFYLVIIQVSLIFPLFIHLEVILSYLGLGVDEGVSWGQMINASLQEMIRTPPVWWQLVGASIAVFGISLSLNLFGDALRDALDPKLQSQTKA